MFVVEAEICSVHLLVLKIMVFFRYRDYLVDPHLKGRQENPRGVILVYRDL